MANKASLSFTNMQTERTQVNMTHDVYSSNWYLTNKRCQLRVNVRREDALADYQGAALISGEFTADDGVTYWFKNAVALDVGGSDTITVKLDLSFQDGGVR
jgi:hypothetical protein